MAGIPKDFGHFHFETHGFGLVFSALADGPAVPKVELTRIHRQAERLGFLEIGYYDRHNRLSSAVYFAE